METRLTWFRAILSIGLLAMLTAEVQANQRVWYLETKGGLDICQSNVFPRASYSCKEIWGLTAGLGLKKDISLNLNYTYRYYQHEKDIDRAYPDYYSGGYYLVHITELGGLTIRELALGIRLHLQRPGKGFYFGTSIGMAGERYSRLVKCLYQPDDSYQPYNYFLNYIENIPDTIQYKSFFTVGAGFNLPIGSSWSVGLEPAVKIEKDNVRISALATLGRY